MTIFQLLDCTMLSDCTMTMLSDSTYKECKKCIIVWDKFVNNSNTASKLIKPSLHICNSHEDEIRILAELPYICEYPIGPVQN